MTKKMKNLLENIVKKYGGYVEFIDKGEEFEVAVSLYGI